jgi:hypothetical protein
VDNSEAARDSSNAHGLGWTDLGGYVTQISGPSISNFGVHPQADLGYGVAPGSHAALLHQGASFTSLGGYVQLSSGWASDNTDSWEPATRDVSAVVWRNHSGFQHESLYAIAPNDTVEVSVDGGSFSNLGGYSKQISAGLDAAGNPEVYAIGGDNAVWLNKGSGWVRLGGYVKQISAAFNDETNQEVFAIGLDDALYMNQGSGFTKLGTIYVTEVSAPPILVGFFGDLAFAVNSTHQALLHKGSFSVISGGTVE